MTAAVPLAEPDVAVIVAMPLATAVTSPAEEMVAVAVFDDVQTTVAPDIMVPSVSLTVAVRVAVSPTDEKLRLVGDSVTEAAV